MVIRLFALAASFAAGCGIAAAAEVGGHYLMKGTLMTGAQYTGSADITMTNESDCRIKFSDGSEGICMVKGALLAAAYHVHGKLGLGVYDIASDGVLTGAFVDDFHGSGLGHETLTPKPED